MNSFRNTTSGFPTTANHSVKGTVNKLPLLLPSAFRAPAAPYVKRYVISPIKWPQVPVYHPLPALDNNRTTHILSNNGAINRIVANQEMRRQKDTVSLTRN